MGNTNNDQGEPSCQSGQNASEQSLFRDYLAANQGGKSIQKHSPITAKHDTEYHSTQQPAQTGIQPARF